MSLNRLLWAQLTTFLILLLFYNAALLYTYFKSRHHLTFLVSHNFCVCFAYRFIPCTAPWPRKTAPFVWSMPPFAETTYNISVCLHHSLLLTNLPFLELTLNPGLNYICGSNYHPQTTTDLHDSNCSAFSGSFTMQSFILLNRYSHFPVSPFPLTSKPRSIFHYIPLT